MYVAVNRILQIYDLLIEGVERSAARELLAHHAARNSISTVEQDGELVGVAFVWHISDPYDVLDNGFPGENPNGKYLYFPMIYVRKSHRSHAGAVLWQLILKAFDKVQWRATRMVYQRPPPRDSRRLHVIRIGYNGADIRGSWNERRRDTSRVTIGG